MTSMAMEAIEMGLDPTVGPDGREWEESMYRRPPLHQELYGEGQSYGEGLGYPTPLEPIDSCASESEPARIFRFDTFQEASDYAKSNVGAVIKPDPNGRGYEIKS